LGIKLIARSIDARFSGDEAQYELKISRGLIRETIKLHIFRLDEAKKKGQFTCYTNTILIKHTQYHKQTKYSFIAICR